MRALVVADEPHRPTGEAPHRLFVAVPVPPGALEACRALIDGVRTGPAGRNARWVRTENLHLTLRFLGPVAPDRVADVAAAAREAAAARAGFAVTLSGAGVFPAAGRPRALWLGITEGAEALGALAATLDRALADRGWPHDARPYRPHLTVARTDASSAVGGAAAATSLVAAASGWRVSFAVDRVVVYRSHLGGGPPRYEPLDEAPLSG
jgi:RNA 2',3'-cyclic 3'-phosphodiesterase